MKISQERFDSIKQSPRSAAVTDVEDLCDEIERLTADVAALKEQLAAREAEITRLRNKVQYLSLSPSDRAHLRGD